MKVQLLGPLRVLTDDGDDLAPRAHKQRAVLAFLALRVGSVVRASDLIDALWGDEPVESVSSLVKGYISDLRKALGRDTIVTEAGGYRLAISADDVDVTEFEKLIQSSAKAMEAGDPRRALDLFREATLLWRGPPLPDLADQLSGQAEATHLKEWYEAGLERSFDARLALGESESLIADLESAVADEPYRERRWEQLMLALYRAGRRTEAQRAFQRLWKALQEVGGEPREQATALDRAIAVQDPSLQWVAPASTGAGEAGSRFPSGNLTFLFTDIEGSTGLALRLGARYREVLEEHRHLLRSSVKSHGGTEVDTAGDGSFIVFDDAGQALAACLEAQIALRTKKWPPGNEVRVRMGLHTGIARLAEGGYMGPSVHEAARICDAGHGGQVLLSAETARIARGFLPEGSSLSHRGSFMLRGFEEPEEIFQLLHPEMNASFPPLKASLAQSHNLPDTQTTFVGREPELKALGDLLSESRLVTVVGPGGVGKTRLAVEFGARLAPHYEWGIRLCDLSPLDDPARVPSSLATSFNIRDESSSDPVGSVAEALSGHEALLLLDSCEHLAESAGAAIKALTAAVPGLKVLATSRRQLGLDGERVLRIQPLETPLAGASFEAVTDCEAVRLFENR
ncbi:MAG TPA: BTAD domain-containing putative transcriptional regulator, partial [Acidimicrobiales bacterium]|nr:BTAD domain-containing putative transcriptional regulator [Acidimicrobiales bacterium]